MPCIRAKASEEAIERPMVHRVPEMPDQMLGVFSLRGKLIPVFSPTRVLGASLSREQGAAVVLRSFPLQHADEFGSTPWLIGSRPPGAEVAYNHGQRAEGDWQAGDRLTQPDLAKTLRLIADQGAEAFYTGPVAAPIAE